MTEYQHHYRGIRPCPMEGYGTKAIITVSACLHHLQGNTWPYFSVTAEISLPGRRDCESCGVLHAEVLRYWPELAPIVALHLSGDNGQPMHAEANGWYYLAGYYQTADPYHYGNGNLGYGRTILRAPLDCLQVFADHVRLPLDTVKALADGWACSDDWTATRRWYAQWLATQAERFQAEANAGITLLDQLITKQTEVTDRDINGTLRWADTGHAVTLGHPAPIDCKCGCKKIRRL